MTPRSASPSKFYLLSSPRTASHLLQKILALKDQPHILLNSREGYFFLYTIRPRLNLYSGLGRPLADWTEAEKAALRERYQQSYDDLKAHVDTAAAQGKDVFVKEHTSWLIEPAAESRWIFGDEGAQGEAWTIETSEAKTRSKGNDTVFPDEFLKTWLPTFLIRHSALVFPSNYRTSLDLEGPEIARTALAYQKLEMTLHWVRGLYDWFVEHLPPSLGGEKGDHQGVRWPIVLDADDVMLEPEVVRRYAGMVGLDPSKLQFEWEETSEEALEKIGKMEKRMRSTLIGSKGIVKGKTAVGLDLDREAEKWRTEFGEEEGRKIERFVRDAMPDYEYLRERRLR